MKTRTGFVSNSSSSSFIVAFDELPEGSDSLRRLIFGDVDAADTMYLDGYRTSYASLARDLWAVMQEQLPICCEHKLRHTIASKAYSAVGYDDNKEVDAFLEEHKEKTIIVFEIGDNHGDIGWGRQGRALMEADIFKDFPHLKINN